MDQSSTTGEGRENLFAPPSLRSGAHLPAEVVPEHRPVLVLVLLRGRPLLEVGHEVAAEVDRRVALDRELDVGAEDEVERGALGLVAQEGQADRGLALALGDGEDGALGAIAECLDDGLAAEEGAGWRVGRESKSGLRKGAGR